MARGDLDIIKEGLLDRAEDVCRVLLPDGRKEGGGARWMAHDPVAGDHDRPPALSVVLAGAQRGRWQNFRGTAGPAKHDMLGLVAYCQRTDTKGAMAWSRDFLGLRALSPDEIQRREVDARAAREKRAHEAAQKRTENIVKAQRLYHKAKVPMALNGTTHAHAYLAARKVPLAGAIRVHEDVFRFSQGTEYWKRAVWRDRQKVSDGPVFPALHTAMRSCDGVVTACHVTWLDAMQPMKAALEPPKLVRGEQRGAVVEVAMGADGAPFWLDQTPRPVIVCEGIETGLALAHAVPECRVWAAGSITNMANAPVQMACVSAVYVARDNNHGNSQAQGQLERSVEHLCAAGKPLDMIASHVGDDFNDLM